MYEEYNRFSPLILETIFVAGLSPKEPKINGYDVANNRAIKRNDPPLIIHSLFGILIHDY